MSETYDNGAAESAAEENKAMESGEENAAPKVENAAAKQPKPDPGFWELAERTVSLCLRVGVVVCFFGLVAIWSFKRDQAEHPAIELDPADVAYSQSDQGAYFQYGELDPAFIYPGMDKTQSTAVTVEGQRAHIGQFITHDSRRRVYSYYQNKWAGKNWEIVEDKSDKDTWRLNAIDRDNEVQFTVAIRDYDAFNTHVAFTRKPYTEKDDKGGVSTSIADSLLPKPRGSNEAYEVAPAPGSIWGITRTYLLADGPDIAYNYYTREMLRIGWSTSPLPIREFAPGGSSRHAMFKLNEYSCMFSVERCDDPAWGSVATFVIF
ncbi:hypothetical protein JXA32_02310 [Candidatus Sumerlaeota bacterium]|nr:hypothetical protein [Candidatus Sumerlaeota bacterium]